MLRFEESWLKLKDTKKVVADEWKNSVGRGAQNLSTKIHRCIHKLHKWNKVRLKGSLKRAISVKEKKIQSFYKEENDQDWDTIIKAEVELEELFEEEEEYW